VAEVSLSDWDNVEDIVEQALALSPSRRESYLREACGTDTARFEQALRVLTAANRASAFLSRPAADVAAELVAVSTHAASDHEPDGPQLDVVGAYRILEPLGRGGMGDVYLASRADDEFQRQVAIKVVRAGLGGDLIARFRHERQVLASLDDPHIAQLYDGGVTPDGRPYLVMEYVDGRPLDRYADEERLTVDQRLAVFLQVCDAVDRAHRRLVIHRDLKPANILVSRDGVAKLLDFGVAKLLDPAAQTGQAVVTRANLRVMTPEYASPEQFLGRPTTTGTDIYALGVILYELLVGCRPHEGPDATPTTLEQRVIERDPERPSVACRRAPTPDLPTERARTRGTTIDGLSRRLRGDLDNIVMTALNREPDRRYGSAAALRADLERHRSGLPVSARPQTMAYRAAKFIRRHRVGVAAALLLVIAVAAGTAATLVQAQAAAREGRRAQQIRDFLVSVFETSDPNRSGGEAVTARELLDRGSERIDRELAGDPLLRADMLGVLGKLYQQLGMFNQAQQHFENALALRRAQVVAPLVLVTSLTDLAAVRLEQGANDEAGTLIGEALALARREEGAGGATVAAVMTDLAAVHRAKGEYEAAEARHREALAIRRNQGDLEGQADSLSGLGFLLDAAGRSDEALASLREALAIGRQVHGDRHTKVALSECNLAGALHRAGQLEAALEAFTTCVAHRRTLLGDRHAHLALSLNNMALVYSDLNRYDDAERLYQESLAITRSTFGPHHREVAATLNNLAILSFKRGNFADAAERFRELIGIWQALVGPDHPDTISTTNNLGMALRSAGELAESERVLTAVVGARQRALGADHPDVAAAMMNLGSVVLRRSQPARALELVGQAEPILNRAYPEGHPLVAIGDVLRGRALLGVGNAAAALAAFDRAMAYRTATFGVQHIQTAEARVGRGRALAALGRQAEARAEIETALAHLQSGGHDASLTANDARQALADMRR
jgi:serine/threonine-protein kinase